jgi:hypothetical protein
MSSELSSAPRTRKTTALTLQFAARQRPQRLRLANERNFDDDDDDDDAETAADDDNDDDDDATTTTIDDDDDDDDER